MVKVGMLGGNVQDRDTNIETSDQAVLNSRAVFAGTQDIYSDAAFINLSTVTVMIDFGVNTFTNADKQPLIVEPLLRVRMSPHHAKALAILLSQTISTYEKDHGVLSLPGLDVKISGSESGGE